MLESVVVVVVLMLAQMQGISSFLQALSEKPSTDFKTFGRRRR